ncbi:cell division protein ZapE [Poseidonocella sedimentorum]|uniref:Cell division protein ZapE n=1 Tax=Poseidonocella sedimentorum TaxID=871652 RepID=A0A1I6D2S4_9RHOB|nr:cell division protein ZapE [Poseidonocella sedimentorum]SFQ99784.1 cell division protein ZapE [Poseidonocella sedimentorum]
MTTLPDIYAQMVQRGEITADAAQEAVLPEFERIRAELSRPVKRGFFRRAPEPVRGLYIWGGVGRGKSMLMDLMVDHAGVPCRRVHFHAFMQEVHAGMHAARKEGVDDAIAPVAEESAKGLRLLALDEMQITDITDAMIVGRFFEKLFAAGVTVVTTSNRAPDDLYRDGLNRQLFLPFIELLKERMVVRELVSKTDYRQDRLAGEQVYFAPADTEARRAIAAIWADLSAEVAPLVLHVKGRRIELPAVSRGVAKASFFDLCGQPLGPADYLVLAETIRVLILEDIPQMGRFNFNEAKRFVTLIDALYEARVRLICSAAADPEYLYIEGEGSFEFERTASRLREMMSEGWGAPAP